MEEWKEYKLEDICSDIFAGGDAKKLKTTQEKNSINRIPVYANSVDKDGLYGYCQTPIVLKPAVTVAARGSGTGFVAYRKEPFVPIVRLITLITKNNVDIQFLYYNLKNRNLKGDGSAIPQITIPMIKKEIVSIPNIHIQRKISGILSSLDDKIELNRRINENLEQQVQALFKSWFIDFEPFKDGKFVDSELGMIPEGWKVISIGEIVKEMNTGGDAIQKTPIVEYNTGIKCIRVGDFTNNRAVNDWGFTNVNDDIYKQYKLNRGDILITRTASIGLVRYIFNDLNAVYNNGIIRLIINENVLPSLFVYCYLNSCLFSNHISKIIGETSVRPNMKINYVSKFKLLLPTNTVSNKFTSIVSSIYGKIEKNILEIYKLSQLRDTLLPRLMSGELEIKDNSYD